MNRLCFVVFLFITFCIVKDLKSQDNCSMQKDYLCIITKIESYNKIYVYVSSSIEKDSIFYFKYKSLEPYSISPLLDFVSNKSKSGWKVISSNLSFESINDQNSHLFIFMEKEKIVYVPKEKN